MNYQINYSEISKGSIIVDAESEENAINIYLDTEENGGLAFSSIRRVDSIYNNDTGQAHIFREIRIRNFSAAICALFEDILDEVGISIPSVDREGNEDEARLFGKVYVALEDDVTRILSRLCDKIIEAPTSKINTDDY